MKNNITRMAVCPLCGRVYHGAPALSRAVLSGTMRAIRKRVRLSTSVCGCIASMFVGRVRQCFSAVWADGFPRCRHRFPVM